MTGISPDLFGLTARQCVPEAGPWFDERNFYEPHFKAAVAVICTIGKQGNGEWALLVLFLMAPLTSFSGNLAPTMKSGDLCIVRDAWLEPLEQPHE